MVRLRVRGIAVTLAFLGTLTGLSGCGFVHAGGVSHVKPDGFVLRGRVSVPVSAADPRTAGSACASGYPDVVAGAPVLVTDPDSHQLASGVLGAGVIARAEDAASCEFPFEISAVPGGVDRYTITVGFRPPQTFPASTLREGETAVITLPQPDPTT